LVAAGGTPTEITPEENAERTEGEVAEQQTGEFYVDENGQVTYLVPETTTAEGGGETDAVE
jgi:hypothetical protein